MLVTSTKTFELDTGNTIYAERRNPYGHIHLHFDKGPLPEKLQGAYTSYDEAEKAINRYLADKKKTAINITNVTHSLQV